MNGSSLMRLAPLVACAALVGCNLGSGPPPDPPHLPRPLSEADAARGAAGKPELAEPEGLGRYLRPVSAWTLQEAASDALERIGAPAVRHVIPLLNDPDPAARAQAAEILAGIGPEAHEATPYLRARLRDPDANVRKWSARALGQIGPAAAEAVPDLLEAARPTTATP